MTLIQINARYNLLSIIMYSMLCVLLLVGFFITLFQLFQKDNATIINSLISICALSILCLWFLRMVLWFILGKESVHIENDSIIIRKTGTFLITKEKSIPIGDLEAVRLNKTNTELYSSSSTVHALSRQNYILRIQNKGRVLFVYGKNKTFKCLDALSLVEASEVIQKIKREIYLKV